MIAHQQTEISRLSDFIGDVNFGIDFCNPCLFWLPGLSVDKTGEKTVSGRSFSRLRRSKKPKKRRSMGKSLETDYN